MMHPSADLQKAIYSALVANTALITLLGDVKIYDHHPQKAIFPYLVIGQVSASDWSTASEDGVLHSFFIHIWSSRLDRQQIYQLQQEIHQSLHDALLTAQDHHIINLRFEYSEIRTDPQSDNLHAIMRFRAVSEPKI